MEFAVPGVVRNKALVVGASGWLDALPTIVADLVAEWRLGVGAVLPGGTEALVLTVTRADGTPAVLKLVVPQHTTARDEITVLRLAAGEGCVALLESDVERGALLLERLGPSMFDLELPFDQRLPLLCDAARAMWRPAPDTGLTTGDEKARRLAAGIADRWERLDRPCSVRTVEHALGCAERRERAHDDERAVLNHGDVHQWNALRVGEGFKLIDPDGLVAEPAYDLGILMREDPLELLAGGPWERARFLSARTGVDADAIWEWGVVERLSTALLAIEIDLQPAGDELLAAAEEISTNRTL